MENVRQVIRKILLKEYILNENLEYVKKYINNSESVKATAETWAEKINRNGDSITFSFANDSTDFYKTSYMLEILMYAIATSVDGKFTLPTINKTIDVNPDKIARGIMVYMFPTHDLNKFAKLITGGGFKITADELERLDSTEVIIQLQEVLININNTIRKYLSTDFTEGGKNFFNYLQTALRYPLRDVRRNIAKTNVTSMDDPIGDGKKSRGDSISGGDFGDDFDSNEDTSYFYGTSDPETPYDPKATSREQGEELNVILKLNNDISKLIKQGTPMSSLFNYLIIGEEGSDSIKGKTLTNKQIIEKYIDGTLDPVLKNAIDVKVKSGAPRLFGNLPDTYLEEFKKQNPKNFDNDGNIIVTKELILFMWKHGKKSFCDVCANYSPMRFLLQIKRDIEHYFSRNKLRGEMLSQLVQNSGILNLSGVDYLKRLLSAKVSKVGKVSEPELEPNLNEDVLNEEFYDDENMSFNDIYNMTRTKRMEKETMQLQEIRKKVRTLILKNSIM